MKTSTKLASAAAMLMVVVGSTSAFAGGGGGGKHGIGPGFKHFHNHHLRHTIHLYLSGNGGCGYLYDRWLDTGSFYWKRRYFACRGWW